MEPGTWVAPRVDRCPQPCGKQRYESRGAAKREAARLIGKGRCRPGTRLRAYQCPGGEWFHLTSGSVDRITYFREHREAS